jgi:hypothetical protein
LRLTLRTTITTGQSAAKLRKPFTPYLLRYIAGRCYGRKTQPNHPSQPSADPPRIGLVTGQTTLDSPLVVLPPLLNHTFSGILCVFPLQSLNHGSWYQTSVPLPSMNGWPSPEPLEASTTTQKVENLKERCWDIIQYGIANGSSQAPASYVVQLALTMHSAFEEVKVHLQRTSESRQATDHLRKAQITLEQTTKSLVAAVATSTNRAEDLAQEARTSSAKTPCTSIPNIRHPDAGETSESDLQIRLRWEDRTTSPYRKTPPNTILKLVNGILGKTDNPSLNSIRVAAVRKLISGDLDLYTFSVAEKGRLLYNSGDWLAQLEKGHAVRVMDKQYAILAHSVPFEFYPKSRAMVDAKEEVLRSNPGRFEPKPEILYLGWAKGFKDKTCKKTSSSLIIAFGNPRHANQAIQEGIFLRGALVRTELYDPSCRVVQCSRCYQFGHVAAMCPSPAVCPYCSLAHGKKQCPNRKNPAKHKCPSCKGPHAANDRQHCPRWIEQSDVLEQAKRKKARLFPVPVPQQSQSTTVIPSVPSSTPLSARQPADIASNTGEGLGETGNSGKTTREPLASTTRDPLDDNLPSFGKNDKPQTVRQQFQKRIAAQLPKNRRIQKKPTASTATTSTSTSTHTQNLGNLAPRPSSLQTLSQQPAATQREKEQSSHSSISTRKRATREEPPPQPEKRPRHERSSSTTDEDSEAADELESESESIAKIFARTPSKRTVKITTDFIEAQAAMRKTTPPDLKDDRVCKGSPG